MMDVHGRAIRRYDDAAVRLGRGDRCEPGRDPCMERRVIAS